MHDVVEAKFSDSTFVRAIGDMARADIISVLRSAAYDAAKMPKSIYKVTVPRTPGPGPHLADSLGIAVRVFKNGDGVYALIGEKIVNGRTMVKNYHVQERGSGKRVRKRIGGKYAWVETVLANMPPALQEYKRRTGSVAAQNWLRDIFIDLTPSMLATIVSQVKQRIIRKYTDARL